jgi:iron complex transport system substrate-binding protein
LLLALATFSFIAAILARSRGPATVTGGRYVPTHIEGKDFPKVITSGNVRQTLLRAPRRVASLTVTADEILGAIAAPDRIAAVTRFADDPTIERGAGVVPKTAARIAGIDPERLIALEPDLVFVAHYTLESAVRVLSSAAIPVVRLRETRSYADVEGNVRLAAAALGEADRGDALIRRMRADLARVTHAIDALPRPRVLYYSAVGYTSGSGTLVDEKIRLSGGRNAAAEAGVRGFQNVSLDLLVALDPDVILVPRWSPDETTPVREVTESAIFRDVAAVKARRVFAVAAAELTSESPEGAAGVELIARLLHPEAFAS